MRILHRIIVPERAVASDAIEVVDLGVNPLSVLLIAIRPTNETSTVNNVPSIATLCQSLNRITVMHRGASIFSMSGLDAFFFNYFRYGILPAEANPLDTDNARRCAVLPIIMGRFPYDPRSCVPETIRGELQMEMDIDVADTGYDGFRYSVESIELLGAQPSEFERKTTIAQTFSSTGTNDIRLPIGHRYRGVLAWGTTGFLGASPAPTLGRFRLLADGTDIAYTSTDFEVAMMLHCLQGKQASMYSHAHRVNATASSTTELSAGPINLSQGSFASYAFLDLDPTRDDTFSVDTRGLADWILQCEAEAAEPVRVIAIEQIRLGAV